MTDTVTHGLRTREIEEVTNRYLIHPLSRWCVTHFARWHVRPNAVSLAGMLFGAAAAVAYFHYPSRVMTVAGFLLMLGWHVMDGADGQLARMTGQTSEVGKVLDGLCDHLTFTLVYLSLALALTPSMGAPIWLLAVLAGASHLVQASAYEFQRQSYDYWVHDRATARMVPPETFRASIREKRGLAAAFARLQGWYMAVQYRFAVYDEALFRRLGAATIDPADAARVRDAYRSIHAVGVRRWALLSSNYRTLALFVACLAGQPAYYFVFEIVVLNVALALLSHMQRKNAAALHAWLAAHASKPAAA